MSCAELVRRSGVGGAFVALMEARMLASSSAVERWAPRRRALSAGGAKKRSARLSQGPRSGVVHGPAWPLGEPVPDQLGLADAGVVHDHVDVGARRDGRPDR